MVTDDVDVKGPRASARFQERKKTNLKDGLTDMKHGF